MNLAEARNMVIKDYARQIANDIIDAARSSGTDPIAWVTGNSYMPPMRDFSLAEEVWQDVANADGELFAMLVERVETYVDAAGVALESPEWDNALYAVDLRRFEYVESENGDNLRDDWRPVES
jgi:hypothetical protein